MAYNPQLYQVNPYNNINTNYSLYGNQNVPNLNQSYFPQMVTPPLVLSAAYTKGEIGASSYPVAAGNTVILLDSDTIDSDSPIIYIKTTNYDGKPQTIKKITGTVSYPNEQGLFTAPLEENKQKEEIDLSGYAKVDDLKGIKDNIEFVSARIDDFENTVQNINDNLNSITDRFNNMFNAFSNKTNTEEKDCKQHNNNRINYTNKKPDKKGSIE